MPPSDLRCDDCGCRFPLDRYDRDARRVRCPECGAAVRVGGGAYPDRPRKSSAAKWIVVAVVLVILLVGGCCGGLIGLVWLEIRPTPFPEQTEDYVQARAGFQTALTSKGPAPQPFAPEAVPAGVSEVGYPSGKLQLKAWMNPPPPGAKNPAVLYLHGGFAFDSTDWDQCKPFRDAGFVTMVPLLRGENGQAGNFTLFYDEVDDVVAAGEALAKTPGVDPNRVFVAGHSAGGTLAMLGAMASSRFKGCASFSGSPDQPAFVRGNPGLAPFDESDGVELRMRSPLAFPKSFKCPARLYWGDDEIEFRFATRRLADRARAAGQDVQAIEIPGDHTTAVGPAMQQAVTFFRAVK
jgi:dienelactone hydrolase